MPKHKKFCDRWWDDLPESAKTAAGVLGYTKQSWDTSEKVPYDDKPFDECTLNEKAAALYLGMPPLSSKKLYVYWKELSEETQKQMLVLTYTPEKWDDDWEIWHLECENWWWKDMTDEQIEAARYIGYQQNTWDVTGEENFELIVNKIEDDDSSDDDDDQPEEPLKEEEIDIKTEQVAPEEKKDDAQARPTKKKLGFKVTKFYGGEGGDNFDSRNHRFVQKIEVFHNGKVVSGIKATFCNNRVIRAGKQRGDKGIVILGKAEYISKVDVRDDGQLVQELTFHTNTGKKFGPYGGQGRLLINKPGKVSEVPAPEGYQLCGLMGRADSKRVHSVALRWGAASTCPGVDQS